MAMIIDDLLRAAEEREKLAEVYLQKVKNYYVEAGEMRALVVEIDEDDEDED